MISVNHNSEDIFAFEKKEEIVYRYFNTIREHEKFKQEVDGETLHLFKIDSEYAILVTDIDAFTAGELVKCRKIPDDAMVIRDDDNGK